MTARWRFGALTGEALRNLRGAPIVTALLALVVALMVVAGVVVEAGEARRARTELAARIVDGGWVTVARAAAGVDAAACGRLAHQPGILAAGGVRKPTSVAAAAAPGTFFEAYDATPGFTDVLVATGGDRPSPGAVTVGPALATELGLVDGSQLEVPSRGRFQVRVLPASMRVSRFARALLVPRREEQLARVDECWVEWVPGTPDTRALTEALLAVDVPLSVSATLTSGAHAGDPLAAYAQRWTRWWFVGVGVVATAALAVSLRSRRRAMALYVAVGTGRAELAALFGVEVAVLATAATVAGTAWGLALHMRAGATTAADVVGAVRGAASVPACATVLLVAALTVRRGDVAAELKAE